MGGALLEDFRVLYDSSQQIKMHSIERDRQVFLRQNFHLPSKNVELHNVELFEFIDSYESTGERSIFWLDYTDLRYSNFEYFEQLLNKASNGSVIKITLRAQWKDYEPDWNAFNDEFRTLLPGSPFDGPFLNESFAISLKDMLRRSVQRALPGILDTTFQPITCFRYADGAQMVTLAGVLCFDEDAPKIRSLFVDWEHANLDWGPPRLIDVPVLSTQERLHLQRFLPHLDSPGQSCARRWGT